MPLTFAASQPDYAVGQIINMEEWNGISRVLGGSTNIPFGRVVIAGTGGEWDCAPLTAASQNILGIARLNHVLYHEGNYYAPGDTVAIVTDGVVAVELDDDVVEGAQARVNSATGKWTDAAASATVFTIPGAQFEYAGSGGAIGVVRFKRPVPCVSAGA